MRKKSAIRKMEEPMEANNMKAMREALANSNGLLEELALIGEWSESARAQIAENNAALAEPPRNCDVGTAEEQIVRFDAECLAIRKRNTVEPCAGCLCSSGGEGTEDCQLRWAQLPYVE